MSMCMDIWLLRKSVQKIATVLAFLIFLLPVFAAVLTACSPENPPVEVLSSAPQTEVGKYRFLTNIQGQGLALNSMVGPGAATGSQLLYLSYVYLDGTLDLVTIDPDTGHSSVYQSPVSSEQGAWGLTVGPDNNMYLGTLPNAHLLQFNTRLHQLIDLGAAPADPASSTKQTYIWQMTVSPHNHNVYACTFPSADLVSYNPLASKPVMVNLGTVDTTHREQYIRYCVADPDAKSPYIYIGLGSVTNSIAAYNVDTHTIAFRLDGKDAGFGLVYTGVDNHVYGEVSNGGVNSFYTLSDGSYTPAPSIKSLQAAPTNVLRDDRTITVSDTTITVTRPDGSQQRYLYTYAGQKLQIFRLGAGPDGKLYGGTLLPYDLFTVDPDQPAHGAHISGEVGGGEPYALLAQNQLLYIAAYGAPPTEVYNPARPFLVSPSPATSPFLLWPLPMSLRTLASSANPATVALGKIDYSIRPQAMIGVPDHRLYIGAIAPYGQLSGSLLAWNTRNNIIQEYGPIPDQGVATLTLTTTGCANTAGSYCLIGGTSIIGGGGTVAATSSAQLFSWNPARNIVAHRYVIPNVPNTEMITDLITNPGNGYVYGIAISSRASYLFIFNPATGTFVNGGTPLPFAISSATYNSVTLYHGQIWGITAQGVFSIDPAHSQQATLIKSPVTITAGFAVRGNSLYFASYSNLLAYTMS